MLSYLDNLFYLWLLKTLKITSVVNIVNWTVKQLFCSGFLPWPHRATCLCVQRSRVTWERMDGCLDSLCVRNRSDILHIQHNPPAFPAFCANTCWANHQKEFTMKIKVLENNASALPSAGESKHHNSQGCTIFQSGFHESTWRFGSVLTKYYYKKVQL